MMSSQVDDDEEILFDQTGLLNNKPKPRLSSPWCQSFIKTLFLSAAFFVLGLCIAIPGPTLLDLGDRVGADTKSITWIFTARSIGYLLGSIVGGFLFDSFSKQLLLCYTLLLTSIATIAIPWCLTLIVLAVMTSIQGVAMGVLDTGGNMFCIHIWGKRSGPYMQTLHFAFGIGAFIAPLLAKPFLAPIPANNSVVTGNIPTLTHLPGHFLAFDNQPDPSDIESNTNHSIAFSRHNREANFLLSTTGLPALTDVNKSAELNVSTVHLPVPINTKLPKKPQVASDKHLNPDYNDGRFMKDVKPADSDTEGKEPLSEKPVVFANQTHVNSTEQQNNVTAYQNSTSQTVNMTSIRLAESTPQNKIVSPNSPPSGATSLQTKTASPQTLPTTTILPLTPTKPTPPQTSSTTAVPIQTTTTTKAAAQTTTTTRDVAQTKPTSKVSPPVLPITNAPSQTKTVVTQTSVVSDTPKAVTLNTTLNNSEIHKKPETVTDVIGNAIYAVKNMSRIQFAYLIIGLLLFVTSMMFLGLYCANKNQLTSNSPQEEMVHKTRKDSLGFRVTILLLLFLFFFMYVGMEVTFGGLILSFAVKYLNWTKDRGAVVTAIFWGSLAAGRGFAIFVAKCFHPPCMLIVDLVLCLIATLILTFGINFYHSLLWVGTVLFGLGMSSVFPTGVSWAEQYLHLTGKSTAVFVVGSALGEMAIPIITGHLLQSISMMYLMYVMLCLSVLSIVLYIIMQGIASRCGNLTAKLRSQTQKDEDTLTLTSTNYGSDVFDGLYKRNKNKDSYKEVEYGLLDQELED